jgi:hypothetical protein
MSLADCMSRIPLTTRWPRLAWVLAPAYGSSTEVRASDLEEQRVLCAGHQQYDSARRPDASDADHLDRHVLEIEAVKEYPAVLLH